jgi:hypothetical protein
MVAELVSVFFAVTHGYVTSISMQRWEWAGLNLSKITIIKGLV